MIVELQDNRVFLNHGPIQMSLDIWKKGERSMDIGKRVSEYIIDEFNRLIEYFPNLKKMRFYDEISSDYPDVLNKMISSVELLADDDMNILGAVAGSFSDIALEKALQLGATRVIINNGGDIALKDLNGEEIRVGIPTGNSSSSQIYVCVSGKDDISGICTSGMGGRSFTQGIATASVAFAKSASIADSCATYIGNKTNVEDNNIIRCLSEDIDSNTDIPGRLITLGYDNLNSRKKQIALLNGANAAEKLIEREVIIGSIICVEENILKIPDGFMVEKIINK